MRQFTPEIEERAAEIHAKRCSVVACPYRPLLVDYEQAERELLAEPKIEFTRSELVAAFKSWIIDARLGHCESHAESAARDADAHAEASVDSLLDYVGRA